MTCRECGRSVAAGDIVPLIERHVDCSTGVAHEHACRTCIATFIGQGYLSALNPFWRRKQGCELQGPT